MSVAAAASAGATPHVGRRQPLALVAVIFACSWAGNQFTPLLLMYQQRDHYSSLLANALLGVYVLGLGPALLIAGPLSDRRGRRPVMVAGVLSALAGSVLLACGPLSPVLVLAGRLLSGATVGIAMAVGTSWLHELSAAAGSGVEDPTRAVRWGAMAFSGGAGAGALVAGLVAQWGPLPQTLPFLIHIGLTAPLLPVTARLPELRSDPAARREPWWRQLRVRSARHPRFLSVILIAAPWIFLGAAIGYGYLPTQLGSVTGRLGLVFATASSVLALGVSVGIQPLARRIHSGTSARGVISAVALLSAGIAVAGLAIERQSVFIGLLANALVGAGIGIGLISGMHEVQRIAGGSELAGLTGLFYALAYVGFLVPTLIAGLTTLMSPGDLLWALAALGVIAAAAIAPSSRRHLPT